MFEEGIGFDGSCIRGFQKIHESDMLLLPDPDTAFVDPACKIPTLSLICDVVRPGHHGPLQPRSALRREEGRGVPDATPASRRPRYFGPEVEFYIFNDIRFDQTSLSGFYYIDSDEGIWNSGANGSAEPRLPPALQGRLLPGPADGQAAGPPLEIVLELIEAGIEIEVHHHEVGTAGQAEIDMRFDTLVKMADSGADLQVHRQERRYRNGYTATFMPKPLFGDNGSGMHVHQSLWKDDKPLFYDENGYAKLCEMGRHYIGGLLKHAPAVLAFAAPTTNSYRRLVPGYEAPINLMYSQRNRSACVRIPMYSNSPKARRLEFRAPDPSCNPYLAFSAMLMAGLDGVMNKIEPPTRSTSTCTSSSRRRRGRRSRRRPAPWARCWTRSKPTTTSCSGAASSPRT